MESMNQEAIRKIIEELYPTSTVAEFNKKAEELYYIQQKRKEYELLEKKAIAELKDITKGKSYVSDRYAYTYEMRKGPIDYASIPVLQSINLEAYRKESVTIWKLSRQ